MMKFQSIDIILCLLEEKKHYSASETDFKNTKKQYYINFL